MVSASTYMLVFRFLHVLGAMVSPGLYYERGLLHPFIDYDAPPPWNERRPLHCVGK